MRSLPSQCLDTRKSYQAEDHGVYKIHYDFGVIYIDLGISRSKVYGFIYAKFLKDMCTMKRMMKFNKNAFLTKQVSTIFENKTQVKFKDLGSYCFSANREYICGKGFTWFGGQCESPTILHIQATRVRRD